ncbi:MAG: hypothetical protein ACI9K2_007021, partial [Myxococcota bacterium]
QLAVRYDLTPLLSKQVLITTVELNGARVDLRTDDAGNLELLHVLGLDGPSESPPSEQPWAGLPVDLDVEQVSGQGITVVYGTEDVETVRLVGASVVGDVRGRGDRIDVTGLRLAGHLATPGPAPLIAEGALSYSGDGVALHGLRVQVPGSDVTLDGVIGEELQLDLLVTSLDLERLDPVAGKPGIRGVLGGDLHLAGPFDRVAITGALAGQQGTRGAVTLTGSVDLAADRLAYQADVTVEGLHVADLYPGVGADDPLVIEGTLSVDGVGVSYPDDLTVNATYKGGQQAVYGQQLDGLELSVSLEGGVLTVRPTSVRGILGLLEATGDIELQRGPMSIRVTGTIEPDRLAALGVRGVRSVGRLDATIRGDILDPEPRLRITGSVSYRQLRYESDVAINGVEAIFDVRVAGSDIRGDVRLTTGEGEVYGSRVVSTSTRDLAFHVLPDGHVLASGTSAFGAVTVPDVASFEGGSVGWSVTMPPAGALRADALVQLQPLSMSDFPSSGGRVEVAVTGDRVTYDVALGGQVGPMIEAVGTFDTARSRVEVSRLLLAPTPRGEWRSDDLHFTLGSAGITDARIVLEGNLGDIGLEGRIGTTGSLDATISAKRLQLDILSEWFPDLVDGLSGTLDLSARVGGVASAPELEAEFGVAGLWYAGQARWLDVSGTVDARDNTVRPVVDVAVAGQPLLWFGGSMPVTLDLAAPGLDPTRAVDATLAVRHGALSRFGLAVPAAGELPAGNLSAALRATGPLRDPNVRLAGVLDLGVDRWGDPVRAELDVARTGGRVDGWIDVRQGFASLGSVTLAGATRMGTVTTWALEGGEEPDLEDYSLFLDDLDVHASLDGLPLAAIGLALGSTQHLGGRLQGDVRVRGSPFTPEVEVRVSLEEGELGSVSLAKSTLALLPDEQGYGIDLELAFADAGDFRLTGAVPVIPDLREETDTWVRGDLDLLLSGAGLPIALAGLVSDGVREATGLVAISGAIRGSPVDPVPELTVAIADASLIYAPLGLLLSNLDLDVTATRSEVEWGLRVHTEPNRSLAEIEDDRSIIEVTGSAGLSEWAPQAIAAKITLRDGAFVSGNTSERLRLEGDVSIDGDWPALRVAGDLDVVAGRVYLDAASFLSKAPLDLDPSMVVDRGFAQRAQAEDAAPPVYQSFDVDLAIDLGRNLDFDMLMPFLGSYGALSAIVSTVDMDSRLGGTLQVSMVDADLGLVGELEIVDGTVGVLQSRFDLQDSKVIFTGADYTEPILDIRAEMAVTGAVVGMRIEGTPSDPVIEFSSEDYPDQSQILTILLTGRAPDDLDADGGKRAAMAMASMVLNSLFGGLGSFSIEPDGSVRAGVPVSQTVHATTIVNPAATQGENSFTLELEWSILPRLVASGAVGNVKSWADLYWEFRF